MKRIALPLSTALLLAACGTDRSPGGDNEPPPLKTIEKSSALAAANANVRSMLGGSAHSALFVNDTSLIGDVAKQTTGCGSSTPTDPPTTNCVDLSYETSATDMSDRTEQKILNAANIEVEEPTRILLKLIPETICEADAECISAFNANPVRLEITSRVENDIDVGILIGEAKTNPIDLTLHRTELAIEIDLGAAKAAAENLLRAMGESSIDIPSTMTGRVRFSIKKNAENDYTLSFGILSAIDVVVEQDGDRFAFHAGAANPAMSLRLDGNLKQVTSSSSFGEISGELPLSSMFGSAKTNCTTDVNGNQVCDPPPPPVTGTVGFRMGAMKATTTLRASDETATIDGIDFGSGMAMTIDDKPLMGFDADVRTVKLTSENGALRVGVLPSLVANVSLDYRNIVDRVMDLDVPSWALDEDITLELKGASEPAVLFNDTTDAIQVLAGSLMIRSRAAGRTVNVSAGQCLIASDPVEGTDPNPVELLAGGTCP